MRRNLSGILSILIIFIIVVAIISLFLFFHSLVSVIYQQHAIIIKTVTEIKQFVNTTEQIESFKLANYTDFTIDEINELEDAIEEFKNEHKYNKTQKNYTINK